jgi:hypothetical protein
MANQNTVIGYYNLPKMTVTDGNNHALTVPTLGSGVPSGVTWGAPYYETSLASNSQNPYPGFPSPALPANSGLTVSFPADVAGAMSVDAHAFKLKLSGVFANAGASTVVVKMYQVPFANLGVISAAGSVTTAGAPGTGDNSLITSGLSFTAPPSTAGAFYVELNLIWDSNSGIIVGTSKGFGNNAGANQYITEAALTALVTPGTSVNSLNFMPSFTFGSANAANSVTVNEFAIERN